MEFSRQEYWNGLPFPSPIMRISSNNSCSNVFCLKEWVHFRLTEPGWWKKGYPKPDGVSKCIRWDNPNWARYIENRQNIDYREVANDKDFKQWFSTQRDFVTQETFGNGLVVQNEAGQGLTEFYQENILVTANTLFQQHKRWLYTWTSPDRQYQNQTGYILCSRRWRSSIHSAKTRLGTDCGSDHELLIAKFRLKSKKVGKTTRPFRYDLIKSLMTIQWKWQIDSRD